MKRLRGKIDRVLVDAPCTGLGTLRRNPDLKARQDVTALAELNAKQRAILAAAASLVKPGGRLVYGTCSLLAEENEDIVTEFLAAHPDFQLVPASEILERQGITLAGVADTCDLYPARARHRRLLRRRDGTTQGLARPSRNRENGFMAVEL